MTKYVFKIEIEGGKKDTPDSKEMAVWQIEDIITRIILKRDDINDYIKVK